MESTSRFSATNEDTRTPGPRGPKVLIQVASLWEKLRHWVDGADDPGEKISEQARGLRQSEKFLKAVAQALEGSLQDEAFAPPGLPVCVPQEFNVFLDPETDREWTGAKRRALEQALNIAMAEKVRDLVAGDEIGTGAPLVILRVDGTLKKDQIRIMASWDQEEHGGTLITPPRVDGTYDPDATHVYLPGDSPEGDETQVIVQGTPLYHLEVWRSGTREALIPITRAVITIGRGARARPVDVRLQDTNISRRHVTVEREDDGMIWVTHNGQNPTTVGGRDIGRGERVRLGQNESIDICSFSLRVV